MVRVALEIINFLAMIAFISYLLVGIVSLKIHIRNSQFVTSLYVS